MFNNCEGEFGKYIVQDLQAPVRGTQEYRAMYDKYSKRILWIDSNVVPGSFQMNTAWYFAVPEWDPVFEAHSHENDEILGFFGSNPDDPYDLGGEIIIALGGEDHRLTRSSMIFVPGGMAHNPMSIRRVDRPIFHFSILLSAEYSTDAVK